ncbi:uncharacterized protein EKO05_0004006 [Ascochyta rabiei]|uniref:uncharacterized protein n=1 Tax=Didymella rabiei TaxID=5454 RepID=UPI00220FC303|nr:uncharacterized protein EKO05_0004006 [Ascochyta rabiei]UPX13500.1 hypothetical protein EKO05_0004006 [Ascochyta rabiei]
MFRIRPLLAKLLKQTYPNITYPPEDAGYTEESQVPWHTAAWLDSACVLAPNMRSNALVCRQDPDQHLHPPCHARRWPYAHFGCGYINSTGDVISSTKLNTLKLSEDKGTMIVGSGPR